MQVSLTENMETVPAKGDSFAKVIETRMVDPIDFTAF